MADPVESSIPFLEWVRIVEVPLWLAMGGALIKHMLSDGKAQSALEKDLASLMSNSDATAAAIRADIGRSASDSARQLAEYKLEATDKFASQRHLQEVEERLTKHLESIERKLDRVAGPPSKQSNV